MLCAICGEALRPRAMACYQAHPDTCHACATLNLCGSYDMREYHPSRPQPRGALSPREDQALAAFRAHMARREDDDG